MIERGLPVPSDGWTWRPEDYLRLGITTLCVGIGGGIAYVLVGSLTFPDASLVRAWIAVLSPVLGLHGVGCLAYYAIAGKRAPDGQPR